MPFLLATVIPVSQFPAFFRCQVDTTIPTPGRIDNVILTAVAKDWEFDDAFSKLAGVRTAVSEPGEEGLILRGSATAGLGRNFEATLILSENDSKAFMLDWRTMERRTQDPEPTLAASGVASCKSIVPTTDAKDRL